MEVDYAPRVKENDLLTDAPTPTLDTAIVLPPIKALIVNDEGSSNGEVPKQMKRWVV